MSDTQTQTAVTIRDATEADAPFLAWVMLTAARSHLPVGIWEYINGMDGDRTLAYLTDVAVTGPAHLFHHSLFQIAEVDGASAAAMCGYDPATQSFDKLMPFMAELGSKHGLAMDDYAAIMERGAIVGRVTPTNEPGAWVIENVATKPEFRRRGLTDTLIAATLDRGRSNGFELAQISVFIGNDPARAAYIKAGFEHADSKRDAEFEAAIGCPGIERLLRSL